MRYLPGGLPVEPRSAGGNRSRAAPALPHGHNRSAAATLLEERRVFSPQRQRYEARQAAGLAAECADRAEESRQNNGVKPMKKLTAIIVLCMLMSLSACQHIQQRSQVQE